MVQALDAVGLGEHSFRALSILPSAARTNSASPYSVSVVNQGARGVVLVVDTTAVGAATSTVITVDGFEPVSGKWYNILTSAAITGVSTVVLRIFPGATPATNLTANDALPPTFRVVATHGNAQSQTYSIAGFLMGPF